MHQNRLYLVLLSALLWVVCLPALGQWRTETFELKAGWQAIYLKVDPGLDTNIGVTLAAFPDVEEVWRWNPSGLDARIFDDPQNPVTGPEWQIWKGTNLAASTLHVWYPNSGYLVKVADGAADFQLSIKGAVTSPDTRWRTDGLNLLGFPSNPTTPPTVENYFAPGLINPETQIFGYVGGDLVSEQNPALLTPRFATIKRGVAYWVRTEKYADYDGPLRVRAAIGEGLDFGSNRTVVRVILTNRDDDPMTAVLMPVASEPAPGTNAVPAAVPLTFGIDTNGVTNFEPFGGQRLISLQPGETLGVSIGMDRIAAAGGNIGDLLQSLMKVTDAGGLTEFYLPVRGEVVGLGGLWAGKAEITRVQNQLQFFEKDPVTGAYLSATNQTSNHVPQYIPILTNGNALVETNINRTAQTFPLNLILHVDANAIPRLLGSVYYGIIAEGTNNVPIAGLSLGQGALMDKYLKSAVRMSAVHYPIRMNLPMDQGDGVIGVGTRVRGQVGLAPGDSNNPFIHTYHPDHDNLDARFEKKLPEGVESHQIDRTIELIFDMDAGGVTDPAWGSSLLTGTYTETIAGIHKNPIAISGIFAIRRVTDISTLTPVPSP